MPPFDDGLLDDGGALGRADVRLREVAESGARVRREAATSGEAVDAAVEMLRESRPRAVVAAGPDARLLRAVLEPVCPVPFLAWPGPTLPGWAGSLDLVVVLAPQPGDVTAAGAAAEAVRRGCQLVTATPADGLVARHAGGRYATVLPTETGDPLATAVVVLELLDRLDLGPDTDPEAVATALDDVAVACSPHRDLAVNPAKLLASGIAETNPLLWGGTVLAARAARRVAEGVRRATGRTALAGDAEHLLPVLEATPPADVFADPFADPLLDGDTPEARPSLIVFDDGSQEPSVLQAAERLREAAARAGVRTERLATEAPGDVARYGALLTTGTYAAEYLRIGLGR